MKILLISPYSEEIVGGIINWTKYIINYQQKYGEDVDLQLVGNCGVSKNSGSKNPVLRFCAGVNNYVPVMYSFYKMVRRESYDVVHISSSASLGLIRDFFLLRSSKKRGIRTVMHMHFGRIPSILQTNGWERFVLLKVLRLTDHIIVMDKASLNALMKSGYIHSSFIPNPLSDSIQKIIENKGRLERIPRKIIFVGHVVLTKGVVELVSACSKLDNIQLELIGQVPVSGTKERLFEIAGEGYERWLSIPGIKTIEEVIESMLTSSVFALPSYTEGFPNVILESMACSCAIVSTPVGAIPEMLNVGSSSPCGIIVPVKDIGGLYEAIKELLNNPTTARELGSNARQRVNKEYNISSVWAQLVSIWTNLSKS